MIGVVISSVHGLVREQVTSYFWGTTDEISAFTIADNVHTMLFDLVISGMLQAALVPVLSAYAVSERLEEFRRIVGALLVWVAVVVGAVVVLVAMAAPWVVWGMTALGGGEAARGAETFQLTIRLVRLIVPAVLLLAFSTVLMGALYALQRFTQPSLALSVRNAAIVACALLLGHSLGVTSLVVGVLLGAFGLAALQLWGLRDCLPRLNLSLWHPAIRQIFLLYLPIFLGLFANTVALTVDRNLAWGVDPHALGAMRYATALNQMILGLVAAATSLAALPTLSRHHASGNEDAYQRTLALGLKFVALLIFPTVLGMAALGWPIVTLLSRRTPVAIRRHRFSSAFSRSGSISSSRWRSCARSACWGSSWAIRRNSWPIRSSCGGCCGAGWVGWGMARSRARCERARSRRH
jgi:putative peptidoglycan lipid II flippase